MTTAQDQQSRADFDAFVRTHEQDHGAIDEPSALAGWQAARALPAGMEPLCHIRPAAALAAAPRPPAAQEAAYISPTRTVADLANNLRLMDQTLPIYGAQYIEHPTGKRRAIAVSPTVSRERIKDGRWIGEGDELNAVVIWTRAEQPDASLAKIAEVAACFGADWPDVEGEPEVLRRVKWAARQLKAAQEYAPLTDERIQEIDDETHFHESPDWPARFARAIEAEIRKKAAP